MRCPKCTHQEDKVIDSRGAVDGAVIRRRRMCLRCGHRFTTYEEIVKSRLWVTKRDGRREEFDRRKLRRGIERACEKRPVSSEQIDALVDGVVEEMEGEFDREVPSQAIGAKVMARLEKMDDVAYVRFASVYRRFKDVNQFVSAIRDIIGKES